MQNQNNNSFLIKFLFTSFIILAMFSVVTIVKYIDLSNQFKKYKNIKDEIEKKEMQGKLGRFFLDKTNQDGEYQITIMSWTGETIYKTVVTKNDLTDVQNKIKKELEVVK